MKVLIVGSTGIIAQHMRLCVPDGADPYFATRQDCDLNDSVPADNLLYTQMPDVIVNLAGESNTDTVEKNSDGSEWINAVFPEFLAHWCHIFRRKLIHISTQAVFSGNHGPYSSDRLPFPINEYGRQKLRAEKAIAKKVCTYKIIRPTFVLGIRPDPTIGRMNPIEQILGGQVNQVNDRFFSVSFAPDVARVIWKEVVDPSKDRIIHAGVPRRTCRYEIALALGVKAHPVSHDSFPGIAPRPKDTTYRDDARYFMGFDKGIADCLRRWEARELVAA